MSELVISTKHLKLDLIPGQKLCPSCRSRIANMSVPNEDEQVESDFDEDLDASKEENRSILTDCFTSIGLSPLKTHALPPSSRRSLGKRKISALISEVSDKVAVALDVPIQNLETKQNESDTLIKQKADQLDRLMYLLKEKLKTTDYRSKVQMLTLVPQEWSIKSTASFFNGSEYIVRVSRKSFQEKGILSVPGPKKGNNLPTEVVDLINECYHNDQYTRQMPGKKDFVSVSTNVHMQKRLIICNLKELYLAFKDKHPTVKVGFSTFCSLRPKWCILVGVSGTHSVCVCTIHQNVKLLLAPISASYKDLMKFIICDTDNKQCMTRRENCPKSSDLLIQYLNQLIGEHDEDFKIKFS